MIRVFLALTIFIKLTFALVPAGFALSRAVSRQSLDPFHWLNMIEWGVAAAIALGFIVFARIGERLPDSRPGFGLSSSSARG
jgi:hypothetical protein